MAPHRLVLGAAAFSHVAVGNTNHAAVTPVAKVISLLNKLSAQISDEGTKEAKAYDEYACFCKNQADEKLYAIEKSEEKISLLTATIKELQGEIDGLSQDITALENKISALTTEINEDTAKRQTEHTDYIIAESDMSGAIDAVNRALDALANSKNDMEGKTEKLAALAQAKAVVERFAGKGGPGAAYEYSYHSNDIIAILEQLKDKFTAKKNELDKLEFESNSAFEKKTLNNENMKKFAEQEKAEKEEQSADKTATMEDAKKEEGEETAMKTADGEFMKVLTGDCEQKAAQFDQRTSTRTEELTAITEAIDTLEKGAKDNYSANKKLTGIQKKATVARGHWVYVEAQSPSFVQIHRSTPESSRGAVQKAVELLRGEADRLKSPALSMIVLKAKVGEDHFVKVRGLIKDIIARLKEDAKAEATTKGFCDKNMQAQMTDRDDATSKLEDVTAQITGKEADKAQLMAEVAELSNQVSENTKALNEATDLRKEEHDENADVVEKAGAGVVAVSDALQLLKKFYDAQGLVQTDKYVPPNSDRSGKTVGDLAPEVFDSEYKGKQTESKGIIGILEVILSDFERTEKKTLALEATNQGEFEEYEKDTKKDNKQKNAAIKEKEGKITDAKDALVTLADQKKDATKALELSLNELDKLKKMCVDGTETSAERVAKREKEIAALKEAMTILDNWKD